MCLDTAWKKILVLMQMRIVVLGHLGIRLFLINTLHESRVDSLAINRVSLRRKWLSEDFNATNVPANG